MGEETQAFESQPTQEPPQQQPQAPSTPEQAQQAQTSPQQDEFHEQASLGESLDHKPEPESHQYGLSEQSQQQQQVIKPVDIPIQQGVDSNLVIPSILDPSTTGAPIHPRYLILSSNTETWSNQVEMDAHTFYIGFFVMLLLIWQIIGRLPLISRLVSSSKSTSVSSSTHASTDRALHDSFRRFQQSYAAVFLIMSAADWLQGPYVYALYNHYGFDMGTIGTLFIIGFASSLICGTMVGSLADKYGRKKLCLAYGIIYSIASATKHVNDFWVLAGGRLLSGISTSILYSSFEAWMIHQHKQNGYPEEWMSETFATCTMGNGIVAIVSGMCAWGVNAAVGPVGPFDLAIVCLMIGTIVITMTWTENRGNADAKLSTSFVHAAKTAAKDPKIMLLGCTQSLFEGAMYVFVFMWTPTLEASSPHTDVHHGWVFASFMLCVLIGSTLFRLFLASGYRVEMILLSALLTASCAIITPALITRHIIQLIAFCIFEMCVGIFWPTMGTLRSRLVPEDVRATIMTFFRVPLNIIVVLTLTNIRSMASSTVFTLCFVLILMSSLCLFRLTCYVSRGSSSISGGALVKESAAIGVRPSASRSIKIGMSGRITNALRIHVTSQPLAKSKTSDPLFQDPVRGPGTIVGSCPGPMIPTSPSIQVPLTLNVIATPDQSSSSTSCDSCSGSSSTPLHRSSSAVGLSRRVEAVLEQQERS